MALEISSNPPINGVKSNFFINPIQNRSSVHRYFTLSEPSDSISTTTTLDKYANEASIINMVKANPEIIKILNESNIPLKINMEAINELKKNHLLQTKKIAMGIINHLPNYFQSAVNTQAIKKAAELHDLGKVFIPANIINKKGALDEREYKIIQKHPVLSYELLKTTDLDKETLELVKNHHQNAQKTGYPSVDENFIANLNSQILSSADIYSALREKRSYKAELSKNEALAILHKDMKEGKIHPFVFKALVDYANEKDNLVKLEPEGQIQNLKAEDRLRA